MRAGDLEFVEVDQRNLFKLGISEPQWSRQWGMRRSGFDRAWSRLEAYDFAAAPVIVAVLDTGVELSHEDLQGRLWQNPGEIPGNGLDDDGNGFVDDVHGWDFADGDADPTDHDGHGTHCAGVIGAAENGRGVVGASGAVQIMALRFLSSEGGRTSDAILALNYAVSMGAEISSNSWGLVLSTGDHCGALRWGFAQPGAGVGHPSCQGGWPSLCGRRGEFGQRCLAARA